METFDVHSYQWLSEDPVDIRDRLSIRSWCLDANSNPYCLRITDFPTFCYAELPEFLGTQYKFWDPVSAKNVGLSLKSLLGECDCPPIVVNYTQRRKLYYYRGAKTYPMFFLTFKNIATMKKCAAILNKAPLNIPGYGYIKFTVYEDTICPIRKMLTLLKLKYSQWFTFTGTRITDDDKITTLTREYKVKWGDIKPIDESLTESWITRPTVMAFDIETYSDNDRSMPDQFNPDHVAYLVSCLIKRLGDESTLQRYSVLLGDCAEITDLDCTVIKVTSEKELVDEIAKIVNHCDPDIISGYNIFGYDYSYLDRRLLNRLDDWPRMGRMLYKETTMKEKSWSSGAYGFNRICMLDMEGRISLDMLPLIRREHKLPTYKLDLVAQYFLDANKHDVTPKQMFAIYKACKEDLDTKNSLSTENAEAMAKVVKYCIQDSELVLRLLEHLNSWIGVIETSNSSGINIVETYTRGQQVRSFSLIYDECCNNDIVITQRDSEVLPFTGGYVHDPIPGVYDCIICLDFASLYPSIIRAYNICYTTLIPPEHIEHVPEEKCNVFKFSQSEDKKLLDDEDEENETVVRSYHFNYIKPEHNVGGKEGILPRLIARLVRERSMVKRKMFVNDEEKMSFYLEEKNEKGQQVLRPNLTDEDKKSLKKLKSVWVVLNMRQIAVKVTANSIYGFLSVKNGGKLPLPEGAMCVTARGRALIGDVVDHMKKYQKATLVYADTDSAMLDIGITDQKQCSYWGKKLAEVINGVEPGKKSVDGVISEKGIPGLFPPPLKMEFEKAMKILLIKKKKYASLLIDDDGKYKMKGINPELLVRGILIARRDNCAYARDIYKRILLNVLIGVPFLESLNTILEHIEKLLDGKIDYKDLMMTRGLGASYKSDTYFMKLFADNLEKAGCPVAKGDRLAYLIVESHEKKIGHKMRLEEQYLEDKEPIDTMYYIKKQLENPIDQLISVGYISQIEKMGNSVFVPSNRHKAVHISQIVKVVSSALKQGYTMTYIRELFNKNFLAAGLLS